MMKKTIRQTSIAITTMYLVFAFICKDWDPLKWADGWRVASGIISALIFFGMTLNLQGDDRGFSESDASGKDLLNQLKKELKEQENE